MSEEIGRSPVNDPDAPQLPDQPDAQGPIGGDAGAHEGPISERVGRDPGNLGDEPPTAGDVTFPSTEPSDLSM
ncbi:MAG TPA: hypothetical protein VM305_10425 [Candidatus Limnocylindrales bacterium]|nr:hypothetical protein [Candidatus Limnocylindrales bacterium]